MPVVTDYTALLSGSYWNGIETTGQPVIVTYSFPTTAAAYLANVDGFTPDTIASFQAFNSAEQDQARTALGEWAAASGLIFVEVAPGQGDINFQLVDFDTTSNPSYAPKGGIGFYPFGDWNYFTYPSFQSDLDSSGDVFMNSQYAGGGTVSYGTLLHEIGHAIGLKHPTEIVTDYAADPDVIHDEVLASDDPTLTIMAESGDESSGEHLKTLDEQAAAHLYGPAGTGQVVTASASGSNATFSSWSWDAAAQTLTETGYSGNDTLRGSSVTDVIGGLEGDDRLFGLNGNDTLDGGAGNDLLNGGPGIDRMTGGAGDDTYMVDGVKDKVVELADDGFDTVLASSSFVLSANVELLQLFGNGLTGKGNDLGNTIFGDGTQGNKLYGLAGADYIAAGSGNDVLDGGTGADTLFGGAGNDNYYVDDPGDVVREDGTFGVDDGGIDVVRSSVSYTLGSFVEKLVLTGTAAIDGTGNALANTINGNGAANNLLGGDGDDTLTGAAGADTMDGGAGGDVYYVDTPDAVHDSGGSGTDQVITGSNFTLAAGSGIEVLSAKAGTLAGVALVGDEAGNRVTGNSGNNNLRGLAGDDTLIGNDGDDTLIGGTGRDTLTGGNGADTFVFRNGDSPAALFDSITDFASGSDRIDLQSVTAGGLPAAAYAETSVASTSFNAALAAATALMAGGDKSAVFVAGSAHGWLFWNTDANPTTPDEAVRLNGANTLAAFQVGDLA